MKAVRNFAIVAHIDHGKSTLADRLLEFTGALPPREFKEQVLDNMDLERERGITIKAHTCRLCYHAKDGHDYFLNLIDTPGHVDFTYEVSRSLAATEGVLLVVDASQGVEAQTIAHCRLAKEHGLAVIPVINKIDLPSADIPKVLTQLQRILSLDPQDALLASAKQGRGITEVLEAIVTRIPPPEGNPGGPLRALIFDSWFDNYQGVVVLVRVLDGEVGEGAVIRPMSSGKAFEVSSCGVFTPKMVSTQRLSAGEAGYLIAGIKRVDDCRIGDTITDHHRPADVPFPGYREVKPMVFCGLYSVDGQDSTDLRESLAKLRLNDSSFTYEPETSLALGCGFRCGFLGLLHMEIIQERLEREYGLSLIGTVATVVYKVKTKSGELLTVENPSRLPPPQTIAQFEEPIIAATIVTPGAFLGVILHLCEDRRGIQTGLHYLDGERVVVSYEIPLNEVILDFYDRLKSVSHGYASFDYEMIGFRPADLIKVDILVNGETLDALSFVCPREKAQVRGRLLIEKMREAIPRQLFEVVLQAALGNKVIARETISPLRKNVTAKCYGGDITRKRKLWEKQKEGKKRMKQVGRVEIPQEAFLSILRVRE